VEAAPKTPTPSPHVLQASELGYQLAVCRLQLITRADFLPALTAEKLLQLAPALA